MSAFQFDSKSTAETTSGAERNTRRSKRVAAVFGGLLLAVILVAVGCSKNNSKSANENQTNQSISNPISSPSPVANTATAPTSQPAATKKVVKKRPAIVAYKDSTSGVSFLYPRKYALKSGEKLKGSETEPVSMNFVQPGGVALAAVQMPKSSYPGTDFASGSFNVSVNKSLTAAECEQFAFPKPPESEPVPVAKVKLGEMELNQIEDFSGEATKQSDAKYYHLFQDGACYEFTLGLGTEGYGSEDGVAPVDREQVFKKLEKIL
ncbi:MAG TPA: hypothetical protein VGF08_09510, partial [Terriglobales bacterium]